MTGQRSRRSIVRALFIGTLLATLVSGQVADAKKPPPTGGGGGGGGGGATPPQTSPTNLHVTGLTPHSISLAWTAPRDTTGVIGYAICCAQNYATYTDGPQTSATLRGNGVEPDRAYNLLVYARYATNRLSNGSNAVNVTTPADTTAPTKPTATVTDIRSTSVTMAWSSVEEGPLWFTISRDGTVVNASTKLQFRNLWLPPAEHHVHVHLPGTRLLRQPLPAIQSSSRPTHRLPTRPLQRRHPASFSPPQRQRRRNVAELGADPPTTRHRSRSSSTASTSTECSTTRPASPRTSWSTARRKPRTRTG